MPRNDLPSDENPSDKLRKRAITRLTRTHYEENQRDIIDGENQRDIIGLTANTATEVIAGLTDAQIYGVGNLGLSLEQVSHSNYTELTPNAITRTILSEDHLTLKLNALDADEAQDSIEATSRVLARQGEGGGVSIFDRLMQTDEIQQQGVALGFDIEEIHRKIFTDNGMKEAQEFVTEG